MFTTTIGTWNSYWICLPPALELLLAFESFAYLTRASGIAWPYLTPDCFKKHCILRDVFEVDNLTVETFPDENGENLSASVEFDDPAGIKETFSKMSSINIVYTIEIVPPINSV